MNQVPVFPARITAEGALKVPPDQRPRFDGHLRSLAGSDVEIVVRKRKSIRTLGQNAWLWGVAYPLIAEALGYEPHEIEELHYGLVAKWGGEHFDRRLGAMVPNKRSSKLSTKEGSDYMEWLVRFGAKECGGVVVPLPGESEAA